MSYIGRSMRPAVLLPSDRLLGALSPSTLTPCKAAQCRLHTLQKCVPSLRRSRSSQQAAALQPPSDSTATAQVPGAVLQQLQRCNQQWLQEALQTPLEPHDSSASCEVYVLGVCFWAPAQHHLVLAALEQLQPDEVLVEQPAHTATSDLLLPHPQWIQTVLDHEQAGGWAGAGGTAAVEQGQQWQQQQQAFASELSSSSLPAAKVGRDIMDPYESFGYYAGLDYMKQPAAIATVLQLCGFLPGQEVVAAAKYALAHGSPLRCIDAPLKLQESWVRGLLANFSESLSEQDINSYAPLKDFRANQQLAASALPPAAADWDMHLAAAAAGLQQQQQQQAADPQAAAEQQALLLFKVAKATAAALLQPDAAQQAEVLARMARLQPLKWRHFALRQQYMAQQVKEAALLAAKQAQQGPKPKLLVIVGRQHCAAIRALWSDSSSSLWKTLVPRGFAPSVVEPEGAAAAAAAEASGAAGGAAAAGQAAD